MKEYHKYFEEQLQVDFPTEAFDNPIKAFDLLYEELEAYKKDALAISREILRIMKLLEEPLVITRLIAVQVDVKTAISYYRVFERYVCTGMSWKEAFDKTKEEFSSELVYWASVFTDHDILSPRQVRIMSIAKAVHICPFYTIERIVEEKEKRKCQGIS